MKTKGEAAESIEEQLLFGWRVNNGINLRLLEKITDKGLEAVPLDSRGRTVARQWAHMQSVRIGWMRFSKAPEAEGLCEFSRDQAPSRAELVRAFRESGEAVEKFVRRLLENGGKVSMFKGSPVLWLCYLISHDSHHRGQIALALKQNRMRLPETVAIDILWRRWHSGRED
jgi:uncharacterized damage-inducible protein DinB